MYDRIGCFFYDSPGNGDKRRQLLSAAVYVVYMLLQDHLVETGLEPGFLGIPLLLISLCSMAGAVLTEKTGRMSLRRAATTQSLPHEE